MHLSRLQSAKTVFESVQQLSWIEAPLDVGLAQGHHGPRTFANNNPGVFGYIGVFSSGPRTVDATIEKQIDAVKAGGVKFYWLGAGTTDTAREGTMNLAKLVKDRGFATSYREIPGRHYWFLWRDFLGQFAQVMFQ